MTEQQIKIKIQNICDDYLNDYNDKSTQHITYFDKTNIINFLSREQNMKNIVDRIFQEKKLILHDYSCPCGKLYYVTDINDTMYDKETDFDCQYDDVIKYTLISIIDSYIETNDHQNALT